jgi:hypothetical protein|tara:strand:+ start:1368 stop:1964 length:597 start_codon:yes stop_codon:yes gene_type:complete
MADLITVQEYKNAEGLASQKDDQRLDIIVPQVSDLAKKYCGTSFVDYYSSDKTEEISVSDIFTSTIIVSESPLVSVTSVKERASYEAAYETLAISDYEYYVDTAADAIVRTTKSGTKRSFPRGMGSVQIAYRAGYSATPKDLKLALFDLVTYYLKDEHKERRSIAGASLQNQGTSGMRDNTDFPDHIKRVLDLHRVII